MEAGRPAVFGRRLAAGSAFALLALIPAGCGPGSESPAPETAVALPHSSASAGEISAEALAAEVEEWRASREARLREPDSWLSLVGLEWLDEGRNLVGSDSEAGVRLPEAAPATVGWIDWENGELVFEPAFGAEVTVDGEPVTEPIPLATDLEEDTTELATGTLRFYVIDRDGDLGVRIKDTASPLFEEFHGIDSYPVDPAWRVEARFVAEESEVPIPDILGRVTMQPSPGRVVVEHGGEEHDIVALAGGEDGSLFLVFGDETNGEETYGGGRFVYSEPPSGDAVVVDFNKAYNPPCVFNPHATCPLPPPENDLPFPIEAGEKMWGEPHGAGPG